MSWTVIQMGSREHYAIPAALHEAGQLGLLFTDSWVSEPAAKAIKPIFPALAARRRREIPDSLVRSRTLGRIWKDVELRFRRDGVWEGIMRRNEWFGRWVARAVEKIPSSVVFSFAHTAREPFEIARKRGMLKILDQMDGSWVEEDLWRKLSAPYHDLEVAVDRAPKIYRDLWREEITMADVIVVNSEWSKQSVVASGADAEKIRVIPLVYAAPEKATMRQEKIRNKRMQALYLGTVCLRKGAGQLFDAICQLAKAPVDFTFAGPIDLRVPNEIQAMDNVKFLGPVDRATADRLYAEADVFLFPTLSDGFGLTQLEALGHGVPVIASTHCGNVVQDGVNGLLLREITPEDIAEAIMSLVKNEHLLEHLKKQSQVPDKFHPRHLASALVSLENARAATKTLNTSQK